MLKEHKEDLISFALHELGRPRVGDVIEAVISCPVLSKIMKLPSMEAGYSPSGGMPWIESDVEWVAHPPRKRTAQAIVAYLIKKRKKALQKMLSLVRDEFLKMCGERADPARWQLIALRGLWMKEVVRKEKGKKVVVMDCVYSFGKRPEEVGPDVEPRPVA